MADRFIEQSKEIANNFIQNIVFIDDKAYKNDMTNNAFSALDVSNVFAQSGKICAVYAPKSISDVNSYNTILNKADVVILDWYLDIEKEENQVEDPDADADNDDPRGEFTLKLISDLLSQTGMLKLLIVYTGETDLFEITNSIYQKVDQHSFHKGDCVIQSLNSKILVRAKKQNSETQFAHNPELKDKIVSYESLPTLIVEEFADMTNGLLSNFALSSISAIRNNTSRMLSVFSPKLDPAYLGHKILLENTFESKQLLIKLFGEAISELLETTDIDTKDWVDNWIENRITDETISINGVSIGKSKDLLKKMFSSEQPRLKDKYTEASGKDMSNKDEGKLQSHTIELFAYDGIDVNKSNVDFAILTHHKNIFQPAIGAPILTLGTVIKSVDKYYVCIQQRCDSVRIKEERRFLFLPLEEKGEYPLIVNNELKLFPSIMAFRASLELNNKEFDVLYSNYEFSRNTDSKGMPSSSVLGGRVKATIESTEDTSVIEAMLNSPFKPVEGKIIYKKTEEDAKMKEIQFKNAYIVHYSETLDANNDVPMTITITFSAEEIIVGSAALDNRWPKK